MDEYNLKPCPFCGGKAEFEIVAPMKSIYVHCSECSASTADYNADVNYCAKGKAADAWNRRIEEKS